MSYLLYLCLFAYSGVQHILCCEFALFIFVLSCARYDASFPGFSILIALWVFSNIYFAMLSEYGK